MNRQDTVRLLNMAYLLFRYSRHKDCRELDIPNSVARDLYDYIEDNTQEPDIIHLMKEGREVYKDRYKTLGYIKHRSNLIT